MSLTDKIIFVSDFIEPGREEFEGLGEVRKLAEHDITKAMLRCNELTHEYCKARGYKVFTFNKHTGENIL